MYSFSHVNYVLKVGTDCWKTSRKNIERCEKLLEHPTADEFSPEKDYERKIPRNNKAHRHKASTAKFHQKFKLFEFERTNFRPYSTRRKFQYAITNITINRDWK